MTSNASGMRVLLVSNMYPSATAPTFGAFVRDQVDALRALGMHVDVVATSDRRTGALPVGRKYARLAGRALWRAGVSRGPHRYDIVHAHYLFPTGGLGAVAAALQRAPLVITCHGSDVVLGIARPRLRWAVLRTLRAADRLIAVSEEGKRTLAAAYGISGDSVHVIDMGVDVHRFAAAASERSAVRRRLGVGDTSMILFVGHLIARKNASLLLEALALIPGVRAVIAGDGPERERLDRLASALGVAARVTFLGLTDPADVPGLMAAADCLVLPSLYEGRPIAVLEAMAAGLPVVASPVGGVPELVREGETGYLADTSDPRSLATALRRALRAPEALRAAARATATEHDLMANARRVADVYAGLVSGDATTGQPGK